MNGYTRKRYPIVMGRAAFQLRRPFHNHQEDDHMETKDPQAEPEKNTNSASAQKQQNSKRTVKVGDTVAYRQGEDKMAAIVTLVHGPDVVSLNVFPPEGPMIQVRHVRLDGAPDNETGNAVEPGESGWTYR